MALTYKLSIFINLLLLTLFLVNIILCSPPEHIKDANPVGRAKPGPVKSDIKVRKFPSLSKSTACKEAIDKFCSKEKTRSNFAILNCLKSYKARETLEKQEAIGQECEHELWTYVNSLTKDLRYDHAATDVCQEAFTEIPECEKLVPGMGERISCLIEHKAEIAGASCKTFLTQMETFIFTDYRLINKFVNFCETDIEKFKCGRLESKTLNSPSSQGMTINCLATRLKQLNKKCMKEMLRVAELQSDDFHLNRPLYHACRVDRETFCANVQSGDARVYNCLVKNKFKRKMSSDCRDQITLFQKQGNEDVKVQHTMYKKCKHAIVKYQCTPHDEANDAEDLLLSNVLVCLEGAMEDGNTDVDKDCIAEMDIVRASLMSDYQLSGQIMSACNEEIHNHCESEVQERGGKVLHCLMALAKDKADFQKKSLISDKCHVALQDLMSEVDIDENVYTDPLLFESCNQMIKKVCHDIKPGGGRIMECLMDNLDDDLMNQDCEKRLLEIEFFVVRDFKLDTKLYRACHKDAVQYCSASKSWKDKDNPSVGPLVFSCLYHKMVEDETLLRRNCMERIHLSMLQRSKRLDLDPRIQHSCLHDLARFCTESKDPEEKGSEIACLQKNYDNLEASCHEVMSEITGDSDKDVKLDKVLMKECYPMIQLFCKHEMDTNKDNPGEIMQCLINHRLDSRMNVKCGVGILHHQIISLKNPHFSAKFFANCKLDLKKLCVNKMKNKTLALDCLSDSVRSSILLDEEMKVSPNCVDQLKIELLERRENIELDPKLKSKCNNDIMKFCSNPKFGYPMILKCLKTHQSQLQKKCHKLLFNKEQEFEIELADKVMSKVCRKYIKTLCVESDPADIFKCLVSNRKFIAEGDSGDKCTEFILKRLRIRSKDYRLNPKLARHCHADIKNYCSEVKPAQGAVGATGTGAEFNGQVLNCLKLHYNSVDHPLTSVKCRNHVEHLINRAIEDIIQDPIIADVCREEIHSYCNLEDNMSEEKTINTLNCLQKIASHNDKVNADCKIEIERIHLEVKADLHFDQELFRSCKMDLDKYCDKVFRGNSRLMSCLIEKLSTNDLHKNCHRILDLRLQMWEPLARNDPESLKDVADNIYNSSKRNYLSSLFLLIICSIFIGGLFCGRVTKRITAQNKRK